MQVKGPPTPKGSWVVPWPARLQLQLRAGHFGRGLAMDRPRPVNPTLREVIATMRTAQV